VRIAFVSGHGCGRAIKMAMSLYSVGHEVVLLTSNPMLGGGAFYTKIRYDTIDEFKNAISVLGPGYIYHIHNEPSWMATVVREVFPKSKIILDVHDSNYWRTHGDYNWYEEDVAAQVSDAFVFPSDSAKKLFPWKGRSVVIPSANPKSVFHYGPWDYYGGLVCAGGHVDPRATGVEDSWRDYTALYSQLKGKKQVYAYSAEFGKGKEVDNYYIGLGCKLGAVSHGELIRVLGRHDWSLVGNINDAPVWNVALPNKALDSLAAGIPLMNFNCPEVSKLIEKYDIGIDVKSVDELIDRWGEHIHKRKNVFLNRHNLSMDKFIGRLTNLYEKI